MPILNSTSTQPNTAPTVAASDPELPTFNFIAGWLLLLTILVFISKSRLGYVAIYYSLLMMILVILLTEYQQVTPLLNAVQSIGSLNSSQK